MEEYCTATFNGQKHISARKVLVSPLFTEGTYETLIDLKAIEKVAFEGHVI
ncbi:MAG: hypothetical protein HFI44_14895 [Lachnospiraceae bacterium]|nr:hypothetical protein [Lachnospiraceae bacterium]GFI02575.1 hypothetical protein IMSAGC005_01405 [Lachnospiraceae bacterium]